VGGTGHPRVSTAWRSRAARPVQRALADRRRAQWPGRTRLAGCSLKCSTPRGGAARPNCRSWRRARAWGGK
jgi:hypothetical protein